MSQVSFGTLKTGDKFLYNDREYVKVDKVKVSCCRFNNAQSTTSGEKIGLRDGEVVKVVSEETA